MVPPLASGATISVEFGGTMPQVTISEVVPFEFKMSDRLTAGNWFSTEAGIVNPPVPAVVKHSNPAPTPMTCPEACV